MTTTPTERRVGRPPSGKLVVYRMPTDERYEHLATFRPSTRVRLVVNALRDTKAEVRELGADGDTYLGGRVGGYARVVALAACNVGTVDHVLVVEYELPGGRVGRPMALSGATIETIELAP